MAANISDSSRALRTASGAAWNARRRCPPHSHWQSSLASLRGVRASKLRRGTAEKGYRVGRAARSVAPPDDSLSQACAAAFACGASWSGFTSLATASAGRSTGGKEQPAERSRVQAAGANGRNVRFTGASRGTAGESRRSQFPPPERSGRFNDIADNLSDEEMRPHHWQRGHGRTQQRPQRTRPPQQPQQGGGQGQQRRQQGSYASASAAPPWLREQQQQQPAVQRREPTRRERPNEAGSAERDGEGAALLAPRGPGTAGGQGHGAAVGALGGRQTAAQAMRLRADQHSLGAERTPPGSLAATDPTAAPHADTPGASPTHPLTPPLPPPPPPSAPLLWWTSLIGKPVVSFREARLLGLLWQALALPCAANAAPRLARLRVAGGPLLLGPSQDFPTASVLRSADVILVDSVTSQLPPLRRGGCDPVQVIGWDVVAEGGAYLGKVRDLAFCPGSGEIAWYLVDPLGLPLLPLKLVTTFLMPAHVVAHAAEGSLFVRRGAEQQMQLHTAGALDSLFGGWGEGEAGYHGGSDRGRRSGGEWSGRGGSGLQPLSAAPRGPAWAHDEMEGTRRPELSPRAEESAWREARPVSGSRWSPRRGSFGSDNLSDSE